MLAFKKQIFPFSPAIILFEEESWLLAVTIFQATNSLYEINHGNDSVSNTTPGHWSCEDGEGTMRTLQNLSKLGYQNDVELNVEEVEKRSTLIKKSENDYKLSDLDSHKNEINPELKKV